MRNIVFYAASIMAIVSALLVITRRSPVAAALWLVNVLFNLSVVYVLLDAHFIAAVQVLVYAGAIMVLFLFVIMLLSLTDTGSVAQLSFGRVLGALACAALLGGLVAALKKVPEGGMAWVQNDAARLHTFGTLQELGAVLYTQWLFPFEAVSLLLLVAIVGAVVVAKSRI